MKTEQSGKDCLSNSRLSNQRRIIFEIVANVERITEPKVNFSKALNRLFRQRPNFGSRDRRLYREIVYTYLRFKPWLDPIKGDHVRFTDHLIFLANPTKEVTPLYSTLDSKLARATESSDRFQYLGKQPKDFAALIPDWMHARFSRNSKTIDWQRFFSRPPIWLRCSGIDPNSAVRQLKEAFPDQSESIELIADLAGMLRCPPEFPVKQTVLFEKGLVEIQDISSQILLHFLNTPIRGRWFDACAGAGGKTLQLSQLLGESGRVVAYDARPDALEELKKRAQRGHCRNISIVSRPPKTRYFDGVLVDAPCSGSGTWRRHPYLMRQTTEEMETDFAARQLQLLDQYGKLVATGGFLVYCTCSLSKSENEEVSQRFLSRRSDFEHFPLAEKFGPREYSIGITVYPQDFDGDGLYVASFQRKR